MNETAMSLIAGALIALPIALLIGLLAIAESLKRLSEAVRATVPKAPH